MRHLISGLVAAVAVVGASAAPAMACGGYYASGCSPCAAPVVSPCGYGYGLGYGAYETLPQIAVPQYYYVNQGPAYTGPGNFAPYPTYQERAVSGWEGVESPYYYGYYGGPYSDATSHYYDGAPAWSGPAIYGYRFGARRAYRHYALHRYGYGGYRTGYGYRGYRAGYGYRGGYRYGGYRAAGYGYRGGYRYGFRGGYSGRVAARPAYRGGMYGGGRMMGGGMRGGYGRR